MKKYTEDDIKGLTKAQVIEKLTEEGVTFDANQKKDELVALLLKVEVPDQESPENNEGEGAPANPEEQKEQPEEEPEKEQEETQSPEGSGEGAPESEQEKEHEQESQEDTQSPEGPGEGAPEPGPSDSVLEAEKKLAAMQTGKTADHAAFEAALSARSGKLPAKGSFEDELAKRRGGKLKKISFGEALAARLRNVRNK